MENPVDIVKKVADELKELADKAGVGNVEKIIGELEEIKVKAKRGPGDALDKMTAGVNDLKGSIKNAMDNPVPEGGALSLCAEWYKKSIVSKLKALSDEADDIAQLVKSQSNEIGVVFQDLSSSMTEATDGLAETTMKLTGLPDEVTEISEEVKSLDDVKEIDTDSMEKSCDISDLDKPLDNIESLKKKLGPALDPLNACLEKLSVFKLDAPKKIKEAFEIPKPLCCFQTVVPTPEPMQDMLDKLELLSKINVHHVVTNIKTTQKELEKADVGVVKEALGTFSEQAKEKIEVLSAAVSAAKSGDRAKELASKLSSPPGKSLRKFF